MQIDRANKRFAKETMTIMYKTLCSELSWFYFDYEQYISYVQEIGQ